MRISSDGLIMVLEQENLNWNKSMAVRMLGRKNWLKRFKMEKRPNYPFKVFRVCGCLRVDYYHYCIFFHVGKTNKKHPPPKKRKIEKHHHMQLFYFVSLKYCQKHFADIKLDGLHLLWLSDSEIKGDLQSLRDLEYRKQRVIKNVMGCITALFSLNRAIFGQMGIWAFLDL